MGRYYYRIPTPFHANQHVLFTLQLKAFRNIRSGILRSVKQSASLVVQHVPVQQRYSGSLHKQDATPGVSVHLTNWPFSSIEMNDLNLSLCFIPVDAFYFCFSRTVLRESLMAWALEKSIETDQLKLNAAIRNKDNANTGTNTVHAQ